MNEDQDVTDAVDDEDQDVTADEGQQEAEADDHAEPEETTDDDEGEFFVAIGDEEPQQEDESAEAPEWVKKLRKDNREMKKKLRKAEAELAARQSPARDEPLPSKPKLADFDYDEDKFDKAIDEWHGKKLAHEKRQAEKQRQIEAQKEVVQSRYSAYNAGKAELSAQVRDFDDAEDLVTEVISTERQNVILMGAENPALVVYAIGRNPEEAKRLSEIDNDVKFAFEVAKLESKLKTGRKKAPPAPERKVSGSANGSGAMDTTLERLRAEAAKSGDMTKVMAYKKQMRERKG